LARVEARRRDVMDAILHPEDEDGFCQPDEWVRPETGAAQPFILVKDVQHAAPPTACAWGLSPGEFSWLTQGVEFMRAQRKTGIFISVENYADTTRLRALCRMIKNDLVKHQRRLNMSRAYWLEVVESIPAPHAHIIAILPTRADVERVINSLRASKRYGPNVRARRVNYWPGLPTYVLKEATPQAHAKGKKAFRRKKGSHRLDIGGDRVRASKDLSDAMIRSGLVDPRTRTYSHRKKPASVEASVTEVAVEPVRSAVNLDRRTTAELESRFDEEISAIRRDVACIDKAPPVDALVETVKPIAAVVDRVVRLVIAVRQHEAVADRMAA
jgi:hypothetical protein